MQCSDMEEERKIYIYFLISIIRYYFYQFFFLDYSNYAVAMAKILTPKKKKK